MQPRVAALENHLNQIPEDARARILLAGDYAEMDRVDDSMGETNLARVQGFHMGAAGHRSCEILHGDAEFERPYPAQSGQGASEAAGQSG